MRLRASRTAEDGRLERVGADERAPDSCVWVAAAQHDEMGQHRGAAARPGCARARPARAPRRPPKSAADRLHRRLRHQPLLAVPHRRAGGGAGQDALAVLQLDLALVAVPFPVEVHAAEEERSREESSVRLRSPSAAPVVATTLTLLVVQRDPVAREEGGDHVAHDPLGPPVRARPRCAPR